MSVTESEIGPPWLWPKWEVHIILATIFHCFSRIGSCAERSFLGTIFWRNQAATNENIDVFIYYVTWCGKIQARGRSRRAALFRNWPGLTSSYCVNLAGQGRWSISSHSLGLGKSRYTTQQISARGPYPWEYFWPYHNLDRTFLPPKCTKFSSILYISVPLVSTDLCHPAPSQLVAL